MAVCDLCKGTGRLLKPWYDTTGLMTGFTGDICFKCDGKGTIGEPMTNEEWFTSLSTEEKAMAIVLCCPYEINWFGENFEKRMEQRMKNLSQSAQGYGLGIQKIKEWLKQPHTTEVEK